MGKHFLFPVPIPKKYEINKLSITMPIYGYILNNFHSQKLIAVLFIVGHVKVILKCYNHIHTIKLFSTLQHNISGKGWSTSGMAQEQQQWRTDGYLAASSHGY